MVGVSSRARHGPVVVLSAGLLLAIVVLGWRDEAVAVVAQAPVAAEVAGALRVGPLDAGADSSEVVRAALAPTPLPAAAPQPVAVPSAALWAWIDDLAADDVRGNAGRAMARLRAAGAAAIPALESALLSRDQQQRLYAAVVLRQLVAAPSRALLEVSVEALRRDLPAELRGAAEATRFLARHAALAARELVWGLGSDDPQQQFLCAFLLGCGGHAEGRDRACAILIEHLADNRISGDALMSAHALYRFGEPVLGSLRAARPWAHGQARDLLRLVELDLLDPPRDDAAWRQRQRMHRVTRVYHDPAIQFDVRRSRVATW